MDDLVATPLTAHVKNIAGQRFGRWLVQAYAGTKRSTAGESVGFWNCLCDCGNHGIIQTATLNNGKSKSCGCLKREQVTTLFGWSRRPGYKRWWCMIDRCTNPRCKSYKHYGGRGITVCERWRNFDNFDLDMGKPPSPKHTLHRINNDGPYCPENCKWADATEQANCTRWNVVLTMNGVSKNQCQWAPIVGIKAATISRRKKLGWSDLRALTEPLHPR